MVKRVALAVAAALGVSGCDLGYGGLFLTTCDQGDFPGSTCQQVAASSSGGVTAGGTTGTGGTSGSTGASTGSASGTSSGGALGTTGSAPSGGSTGGACGTLTVNVVYDVANIDYQGVVAVADGTPYLNVNGASPTFWNDERAKSWTTLANHLQAEPGSDQAASQCLPPGNYTLQFWDIWGEGGTSNNGTPPEARYLWEIGDPSRVIPIVAGDSAAVRVEVTQSNVPSFDNLNGDYALWSYGACADAACPSGTTCYQGTCYDTGYDIRNCGGGGVACNAKSCCAGSCTDTSSDPANCGGCGVVCSAGTVCTAGQCEPADGGCGILTAGLADGYGDPTTFTGLLAVANGLPHQNFAQNSDALWPAEAAKAWTVFDSHIPVAPPSVQSFYSICVPPGSYTVQYWDIECVGNTHGCGTYDNGVPPSVRYVWEIGDSSRLLPVAEGTITAVSFETTSTSVPKSDNFYGVYSLWSYGGCADGQSDCAPGTTCYAGVCYDMGYDVQNCGDGGAACNAENCCAGKCVDIGTDSSNCGGCGIACPAGTTCSAAGCH